MICSIKLIQSQLNKIYIIGLDKQNNISVQLHIFSYPLFFTYVLGAQNKKDYYILILPIYKLMV